jgi:hypothetical protein
VNFKTRLSLFSFFFLFCFLFSVSSLQQPNDSSVSQFRHHEPSSAAAAATTRPDDDDNNPDRSRPDDIAPPVDILIADGSRYKTNNTAVTSSFPSRLLVHVDC